VFFLILSLTINIPHIETFFGSTYSDSGIPALFVGYPLVIAFISIKLEESELDPFPLGLATTDMSM